MPRQPKRLTQAEILKSPELLREALIKTLVNKRAVGILNRLCGRIFKDRNRIEKGANQRDACNLAIAALEQVE